MFDSALFLAVSPETGHLFIESSDYGATPSNLADWQNYISKTIDRGGDMTRWMPLWRKQPPSWGVQLKMKVTVMAPSRRALCTDFGMLDGAALNLSGDRRAESTGLVSCEVLRRLKRRIIKT